MIPEKKIDKVSLTREEVFNLLRFVEDYPECDNFTLGVSDNDGIGQAKYAITDYRNDGNEPIVDNSFRDITDYESW